MAREVTFPAAAVSALASGNRIQAIKLLRDANPGLDLRGALEAVEAQALGRRTVRGQGAPTGPAATPHGALPPAAIDALARGQVIEAIRLVRESTGLGLKEAKEAKDAVDAYRQGSPPVRDHAMREKMRAMARKHGVTLPEAALVAVERGDLKQAMQALRQAKGSRGASVANPLGKSDAARKHGTVSHETNRHGWLWALLVLGLVAAWVWLR